MNFTPWTINSVPTPSWTPLTTGLGVYLPMTWTAPVIPMISIKIPMRSPEAVITPGESAIAME